MGWMACARAQSRRRRTAFERHQRDETCAASMMNPSVCLIGVASDDDLLHVGVSGDADADDDYANANKWINCAACASGVILF